MRALLRAWIPRQGTNGTLGCCCTRLESHCLLDEVLTVFGLLPLLSLISCERRLPASRVANGASGKISYALWVHHKSWDNRGGWIAIVSSRRTGTEYLPNPHKKCRLPTIMPCFGLSLYGPRQDRVDTIIVDFHGEQGHSRGGRTRRS